MLSDILTRSQPVRLFLFAIFFRFVFSLECLQHTQCRIFHSLHHYRYDSLHSIACHAHGSSCEIAPQAYVCEPCVSFFLYICDNPFYSQSLC